MARLPWRRRSRSATSPEASILLDSSLFDEAWVSRQVGASLSRTEAVDLYLSRWVEGLQPHPLVDPLSILGSWSDARRARLAGIEPLTAVLEGRLWGSATHPLFEVGEYLRLAPEAREHLDGPSGHYLAVGRERGIEPAAWLPAGTDLEEWLRRGVATPHQVDLEASPAGADVTALVRIDRDLGGAIRNAVRAAASGLQVAVDSAGATPEARAALAALPAIDPRITVDDGPAITTSWMIDLCGVRRLPGGTTWWSSLVGAGADEVSPVLVTESGEIVTAGRAVADGGSVPFLGAFAADEARGLAGVPFHALDPRALLTRTQGPRVSAAPERRVVPDVRVVVWATEDDQVGGPVEPDETRLWTALGFRIDPNAVNGPRAVAWTPTTQTEPRPLRWAIKNPAVSGEAGDAWGDTHFADSLADALRGRGHHVVIDRRGAFDRPTAELDDVALLLRGRKAWTPPECRAHSHLMWIISHPDEVDPAELTGFDAVFAASRPWAEERTRQWGRRVQALLQATDPDRFHEDARQAQDGTVLFVGNTRGEYRRIVRDAVESEIGLTVIGGGWDAFLPAEQIATTFVANDQLSSLYAAARVVLNDHWDDMRRDGFISNRLFDAVASGARVITDDIEGVQDLFGRSVQPYRTAADLAELATAADLDVVFGAAEERDAVARRVRDEHSFAARALTLEAAAHAALAQSATS